MSRMTADEAATWSGGSWSGAVPVAFASVTTDSRVCSADALYLALAGEHFDGHDFVEEALRAGASAAVVKASYVSDDSTCALLRVPDTQAALRDVADGYRRKVAPRMIGITGSVGKSTVKEMIAAILGQVSATAATRGNWNNAIGLPLSLLAMEPDTEVGVFEVGSNHPGEVADLCGLLRPDWGVVTTIGASHLEHFGSEEAVAEEKGALLASLPSEGVAFLDCDTVFFDVLRHRTAARLVSVGVGRTADYSCPCEAETSEGVLIEDHRRGERHTLRLPLPGAHQVHNLLLSVAVAREAGVSWEAIDAGIAAFKPLPMRWAVQQIRGITMVNDAYNANPTSMQAALATFQEMPVSGHRWLVLGDMLELGSGSAAAHRALGERIATGEWAGLVSVGELATAIADAAAKGPGHVVRCATAAEAGEWLTSHVAAGDAVLLKGSRSVHLEVIMEIMVR
ncbi:MAG: UDP-N-acetylmuramoyl-tripeptide--D-alanyl-D-alanine ligase [Lentisphaerae bacterium]|nr:UDP-N-acetylmuramoyl-tripeptide--D-alanyl-D-alanine ligase [Lentisphaerota bacterium]